jgi:hypothetical protein
MYDSVLQQSVRCLRIRAGTAPFFPAKGRVLSFVTVSYVIDRLFPKRSVSNYYFCSLRNNPEERGCHRLRGGSRKSLTSTLIHFCFLGGRIRKIEKSDNELRHAYLSNRMARTLLPLEGFS